jgi:hypothetical protein
VLLTCTASTPSSRSLSTWSFFIEIRGETMIVVPGSSAPGSC